MKLIIIDVENLYICISVYLGVTDTNKEYWLKCLQKEKKKKGWREIEIRRKNPILLYVLSENILLF